MIADAPGHGKNLRTGYDRYPDKDPDNNIVEDYVKELSSRKINLTFVRLNDSCDKMISYFKPLYNKGDMNLEVTDLADAEKTKSQEEINKMFVEKASYIISAKLGAKEAKAAGISRVPKGEPLWDVKQLKEDDWFSQNSYVKVLSIDSSGVTTVNQRGDTWKVSADIMQNMYSADHFTKEVKMNMTDLAEIIQEAKDTIFTVQFKKKIDEKAIFEKFKATSEADIKNEKNLKSFVKEIAAGKECTIIGHLLNTEAKLGRSTVIDLTAPHGNNIRMVDHRSIDFMIYKNKKYIIGKSAKEEEQKKEDQKWDLGKLAVGNWFSLTQYYKALQIEGNNVNVRQVDLKELTISKAILNHEMSSGSAFKTTEKLPLTKVAKALLEAKDSVFTICFNKKIDEKNVTEKAKEFKKNMTDKQLKEMIKEMVTGEEVELTAQLIKYEPKLGRSLCIDLNAPAGKGWRQVDHRTINWLIINNTKYVTTK